MNQFKLTKPVAFIVFNRPDTTKKVFEKIREVKPEKLFVIADGPRLDCPGEKEKSEQTRAIINGVDWPCKVYTDYSNINLGCAKRVSSGLNWVFEHVDDAIILEDDCVPHPTFFRFCQELLNYYLEDERIFVIAGNNFQFGRKRTKYSYYFSRYNHCWGWATWKRAWKHFDFEMKLWPEVCDGGWLKDILGEDRAVKYWNNIFQQVFEGKINSWAYRWTFASWVQSGLSILPNENLVSNIGFGEDATHTNINSPYANMPVKSVKFPLQHPPFVIIDRSADQFTQDTHFHARIPVRIKNKLKKIILSNLVREESEV